MSAREANKPSYIGLLNAISVGESRGGELLSAWARATPSADVRAVLEVVAIREREHGAAFAKRLCELGFSVREKPNERFGRDLACASSTRSDREKFEHILRYHEAPGVDVLDTLFADVTIDAETGALLGRFIAEERDSERRLRACYDIVRVRDPAATNAADDVLLQSLTERLDRLTSTLAEIRALQRSA
jgi:rubrerythrin